MNQPTIRHQFKGKASSLDELLRSIEHGYFTLDGRDLKVDGALNLSGLGLRSLVGAPQVVRGAFDCNRNRLKTLEGGPVEVGGNYSCRENQLVSLKGAPRHIKGNFNCGQNALPTLEGGPTRVEVNYICDKNLLTTLAGCAEVVGAMLGCSQNDELRSLAGAPRRVGASVLLNSCRSLTSLEGIQEHLPEVHGQLVMLMVPLQKHVLGLLRIKGLRSVMLSDGRLEAILNKYIPNGNPLACALELVDAGYEEQAKM
jgi:hypothetical protein